MPATNRRVLRIRQALLFSSTVFSATCSPGATENGNDTPLTIIPVTLSIAPNLIIARQGVTVPATLTFSRTTTSTAPLVLSATGLSDGTTVTFNPATITTTSGTIQLSVTATPTAVIKTDTLIIKALGTENAGKIESGVAAANLIVNPPAITVSRGGTGTGTVTSSPAGINCGSTCTGNFTTGTVVTLTATPAQGSAFAGWSGICSGTATTCSVTSGAGQGPAIATFNSTTPSFAMTVDQTTASVPQGGNGTATVTLARNNFTGAVSLAVSGAPQGLTVTPNPGSISGTTSTVNISASLSLAAGNYPITLTATGTGVAQQTSNLAVQVMPAQGGSNNVSMSFATCDPSAVPIWFAALSGSGPWTRVTAGPNSTFTFAPGATGGVAFVTPDGSGFRTQVIFGTASEITAIATGPGQCFVDAQIGTKRVNGTVSHVATGPFILVTLGGAQAIVQPTNPSYSLSNVAAGKRDLIGAQTFSSGGTDTIVQKMTLRRNVQYANGATAPDLDFIGVESFVPVRHSTTFTNLAGDQSHMTISFVTANGQSAEYYSGTGRFFQALNSDGVLPYAIPDSLLQAGDFHLSTMFAAAPDGRSGRIVESMYHSLPDQTITFGPALSTPTVSTLGTSPTLRLRAQLPSQSAYNAAAVAEYDQGDNSVHVSATAGYFGGTPSTWVVDVPNLAPAAYDPLWGLRSGTPLSWSVVAAGGNILPFVGAPMVDGAQIVVGLTSNSGASFSVARRRR